MPNRMNDTNMPATQFSLILSFLALLMTGCADTNTVINPGEKPVVEAYLAPGQPFAVKLTKEIPYVSESSEGRAEPINDAVITISDNAGKTYTLKVAEAGRYTSAPTERVGSAGTRYTLTFSYGGRTISATTEIPLRPVGFKLDRTSIARTRIDLSGGGFPNPGAGADDNTAVNASWNNPDNVYHFVAAEITTINPSRVITLPNGIELPAQRFTNSPTTGTTTAFAPRSFEYFGTYNIILYRVGVDYADLYRSGGTSTQNLSTPPTNIKNGLGVFTGVNADTIRLSVNRK